MQISNLIGSRQPSPLGAVTKTASNQGVFNTAATWNEEEDEEYVSLLRQAVDEWQDKKFRGLGALSEEEIQRRLREFILGFHPGEDAPQEMLDLFYRTLTEYEQLLRCTENNQMLITTAQGEDEDINGTVPADFLKSQLQSNHALRQQLANPQDSQAGAISTQGQDVNRMANAYESNLSRALP